MVDEHPFSLVASVNIAATDMRVVLHEEKDERFSLNVRIRKVWIPKQYMVYKDELTIKGNMSTTKEKEKKMEGIHTIQNMKLRRRNPSNTRMFLQKRDILFHK